MNVQELSDLISEHRLVIRPSILPGFFIVAKFQSVSLEGKVRVMDGTYAEGRDLEQTVRECIAKIEAQPAQPSPMTSGAANVLVSY